MTALTTLPNIGPAMEATLLNAGIRSVEALRAMGTDAAYTRLLAAGGRPHFIGYYVIEMALQGRPWNDCKGSEKAALRKRFDAIKSAARDAAPADRLPPDLARALDALGVGGPGAGA